MNCRITISQDADVTEKKRKRKKNKGRNTTLTDKISLIMPQVKLLHILKYKMFMPLSGVMVNIPQPLWGQEKQGTSPGTSRQIQTEQAWQIFILRPAISIHHLWPVTNSGNIHK